MTSEPRGVCLGDGVCTNPRCPRHRLGGELELSEQSSSRRWIEVEQRLYWRVDVTDWLEPEDEGKTDAELQELARDKLDYHECQNGEQAECVGSGWGSSS